MIPTLIFILFLFLICGVIVWAVERWLPLPMPFKGILLLIIVLIFCFIALQKAGIGV